MPHNQLVPALIIMLVSLLGVFAIIIMLVSLLGVGSAFATDVYKTDMEHTLVGFTVRHFAINKVRGKFNEFDGRIAYDETDITRSSMQGTIKVASIDTDNPKRDDHLRSADFFDAQIILKLLL